MESEELQMPKKTQRISRAENLVEVRCVEGKVWHSSSSSLLLLSLELSDTQVHDPSIRALLESSSNFGAVVATHVTISQEQLIAKGCVLVYLGSGGNLKILKNSTWRSCVRDARPPRRPKTQDSHAGRKIATLQTQDNRTSDVR